MSTNLIRFIGGHDSQCPMMRGGHCDCGQVGAEGEFKAILAENELLRKGFMGAKWIFSDIMMNGFSRRILLIIKTWLKEYGGKE